MWLQGVGETLSGIDHLVDRRTSDACASAIGDHSLVPAWFAAADMAATMRCHREMRAAGRSGRAIDTDEVRDALKMGASICCADMVELHFVWQHAKAWEHVQKSALREQKRDARQRDGQHQGDPRTGITRRQASKRRTQRAIGAISRGC